MRVTFPRLPDYEAAYSVVERDDGVVYRLLGGPAGKALPHDLVHLVVERRLGLTDGIWGGIAAGMMSGSMRHVRGRRPRRPGDRSAELNRAYRDRILRSELLGDLVEAIAALDSPSADEIRRLSAAKLSVLRLPEPPSPDALAAAARALQVEAARWARLRPGEALRYDWALPVPHSVPPPRDLGGGRDPGAGTAPDVCGVPAEPPGRSMTPKVWGCDTMPESRPRRSSSRPAPPSCAAGAPATSMPRAMRCTRR